MDMETYETTPERVREFLLESGRKRFDLGHIRY